MIFLFKVIGDISYKQHGNIFIYTKANFTRLFRGENLPKAKHKTSENAEAEVTEERE